MSARLAGLYLVTPEEADSGRLLALCEEALAGRPALLQYRCKSRDPRLRRAQAEALLKLCRSRGVPLVINDDLPLALAIGADGVHLGRDDGDLAEARAALSGGRLLGVSCYADLDRAVRAAELGADYLAFGSVYPSRTKPAAVRAPLDVLTAASRRLAPVVAAIGGITLENAAPLVAAGASLLAVVSDVFDHPAPAQRARAYRRLFGEIAGPDPDC